MSSDGYYFEEMPEDADTCELCGKVCNRFYRTYESTTVLCARCYKANPDPCYWCGKSTAFGSGRFVNRIGVEDGWGCAECAGYECGKCDQQIGMDEDVSDGLEHFHPECLPKEQHAPLDVDDPCGCYVCEPSDTDSMGV